MRDNRHKTVNENRLVWWNQQADEEFWLNYFSKGIQRRHAEIASGKLPRYLKKALTDLPRDSKIIEAGCGTGWIVAALQAQGYDVEGIDSSHALVEKVVADFPALPIGWGDAMHIDKPDAYYGAYLSFGVIEHRQAGFEPFVNEAYRVLRPGGVACISVPYFNPLRQAKAKLKLYATAPPPATEFYQYAFRRKDFTQALSNAGFQVKRVYTYGSRWCLLEEISLLNKLLKSRPFSRLKRYKPQLDKFDPIQIFSHMLAVVVHKPLL